MSETVIKVENLSKQYRIGGVRGDLLSERLGNGLRSVFRRILGSGTSHLQHNTSNLKRDKDFWALRDVSFEVKQGEVVGIIGRNGAGKSTLLKILSKITSPTSGRVELLGRVASLLEVGTGFHPELTGRENIFLNGAILGMSKAEIRKKFDEIVAFAEVEKFIDTPVKHYSSGMYVRLAFAVAAHLEPEILIVDEVLAVGDAAFQKKCLGKMGEVARGGRTVLYVSHNMASIKRLCTSVMCLDKGRILDMGEPTAVIGGYLQENFSTDACVEIPDHMHEVKSCLQIRTVEVLNSRGERSEMISVDEDFVIRMTAYTEKVVPNIRLGFGIHAEGLRIATFHTPALDLPESEKGKTFSCRIFANTLLPGYYTVHVGAHSLDNGRALDWVPDAISFSISSIARDGSHDLDEHATGMVSLPSSWESELL
jgi:lipopolysaccharide transport system ATP-binding protein